MNKAKKAIFLGALATTVTASAIVTCAVVEKYKNTTNKQFTTEYIKNINNSLHDATSEGAASDAASVAQSGIATFIPGQGLSSEDLLALHLPTTLHLNGTNGFARIADTIPTGYQLSAVSSSGIARNQRELRNGDDVIVTISQSSGLGVISKNVKYVVSGLGVSKLTPT